MDCPFAITNDFLHRNQQIDCVQQTIIENQRKLMIARENASHQHFRAIQITEITKLEHQFITILCSCLGIGKFCTLFIKTGMQMVLNLVLLQIFRCMKWNMMVEEDFFFIIHALGSFTDLIFCFLIFDLNYFFLCFMVHIMR